MLVLCSFFFVKKQGVFGLNIGDLIVESKEIVLQVFELEEFLLEGGNDCVFVLGFGLVQEACGCKVSVHLLMEFYLEINYSFKITLLI